jgi:hypothetical protein
VMQKLNEELLGDKNLGEVYLTRISKWIRIQQNWLCGNSSSLWTVTFWARRNGTLPEKREVYNRVPDIINAECHWKYTCYTHIPVFSDKIGAASDKEVERFRQDVARLV